MCKTRCDWVPTDNVLYTKYHDTEWGVPIYDDKTIFEFLVLESFQAGLSWLTVLKKRDNFRKAFSNFDYNKISKYNSNKIEALIKNEGIIRNRLKINATINNAKMFIKIKQIYGTFSEYIWNFVGGKPIINKWKNINEIPIYTPTAEKISLNLKEYGFKFLGPTVIYSHMQATGMVNDHTTDCFRYSEVNK